MLAAELDLAEAQSSGGDPALVDSVAQAQLDVDNTTEQIEQSTLVSPIDGVVLEVMIQPGDNVSAYTGVITLAIPQPLEAIANLAFNDTQLLQVGQIGICEEANNPDSRVQCVIRQLPLSSNDVDQTVRVAATLPDLQSGSLIDVTMTLSESLDTLWLPPAAINIFNNRTFVVILTDEGERVQDVTIGLETDERVEILSGVVEGDVVVQQ
ncbi:MAG: HlyD family efflux transporter periplasmic adaptor subunit [Chloroflexota bacterium]